MRSSTEDWRETAMHPAMDKVSFPYRARWSWLCSISVSLSFGVRVASQILVQPCNSFCYLGKQLSFLPTSAQVCSTDEVTIFVSLDAAVLPLIIKSTHCVPKDSSNSLNSSPNIQISHITESFQKPDNWGFHHWTALHHLLQETQLHHQKPWLHQCWSDVLAT